MEKESSAFSSTSLYVGDLDPSVTETQLFDLFKPIGPVASIRVCRDAITRRSLGYSYVNFHSPVDAERALEMLNFKEIKGRPCRIMWSQRDPSQRKLSNSNIFIKNLDSSIDAKSLYDIFSTFGTILSCKVSTDEFGKSRGFGFVHYDSEEAASSAIEKLNGKLVNGKKIFVGEFVSKKEREPSETQPKWTNVFVKNLPPTISEEEITKVFSKFGKITSLFLSKKGADTPKNEKKEENENEERKLAKYCFINFETHEEASKAVDEMNGSKVDSSDFIIFVGKAQKKNEREKELKNMFEKMKSERISKYQGVNLFVKNLDDSIDDTKLREEFSQVGTIQSAKVMRDEKTNQSKGFGFVCFATPEEATKAVTEMNGKMIANKPIFVALAERKDQRKAKLQMQYSARGNPGMARGMPGVYGAPPVFYQQPGPFMYPPQMMPQRGRSFPRGGYPYRGGRGGRGGGHQGGPPHQQQQHQQQQQQQQQQNFPQEAKQILGEKLYPLIQNSLKRHDQENLAGKITGMMIESLNEQNLEALVNDNSKLQKKILEALDVLDTVN